MIELTEHERDILRSVGKDPELIASACHNRPKWLDELVANAHTISRVRQATGYAAAIALMVLALGAYWLAGTLGNYSLWWIVLLAPIGALIQVAGTKHFSKTHAINASKSET